MKRYPQYKDSGISWIGEVPAHWARARYKDILVPKDIRVGNDTSYTLLSLTKQGVIIRDLSEGKGKFPKDFESYKIVHPKDFILCLFDVDETPRTVGVAKHIGMITGAYDVFSVQRMNLYYLYYHYLSLDDKKCLKPLYKGLRKTIPLPRLMSSHIYMPPAEEQEAIVDFLDQATAKIDEFIELKEVEIEKLGVLKQSIISHVVTRGLDPNVPMKDSGISWIGKIPQHWHTVKIGSRFTERRQKVSDKDFRPLSVAKIGVVPQLEDACKTDNGDNRKLVKAGDFVVNSRSDRKGSCGVSDLDGSVSLINIVLTPHDINSGYIHYMFRSNDYIEEFYRNGRGIVADLWTTRYSEMKNIFIPEPPMCEQQAIVVFLNRKNQEIDGFIANIRTQIEKLKIYRQRLISDAVTGKIDVRTINSD